MYIKCKYDTTVLHLIMFIVDKFKDINGYFALLSGFGKSTDVIWPSIFCKHRMDIFGVTFLHDHNNVNHCCHEQADTAAV
jgi:hypothetical protein